MTALKKSHSYLALIVLGLFLSLVSRPGTAQTCQNPETSIGDSQVVTLKAVGDIVLGSDWPESHYPPGFEEDIFSQIKKTLGNADVIFGNFEGALTRHDVSNKKNFETGTVFAFRMPPRFAPLLKSAGFDVMHISNNHTFDFGEIGFLDTLKNLSDANILTVGDKNKIVLQQIKDVTLAWIGFSYSERHNDMRDMELLAELIGKARAQADLVIVSVQAGAEGSEALRVINGEEMFLGEKRGNVFAFGRKAVDLGADLVLGHGPHVLRGMECYQGKLIAYSLGNFIGYGALSKQRAAAISAILEVRLTKDRQTLNYNVIPVKFNDQKIPYPDEDNFARYLINDLSRIPPLSGTVNLPSTTEGEAKYRVWRTVADLDRVINGVPINSLEKPAVLKSEELK